MDITDFSHTMPTEMEIDNILKPFDTIETGIKNHIAHVITLTNTRTVHMTSHELDQTFIRHLGLVYLAVMALTYHYLGTMPSDFVRLFYKKKSQTHRILLNPFCKRIGTVWLPTDAIWKPHTIK